MAQASNEIGGSLGGRTWLVLGLYSLSPMLYFPLRDWLGAGHAWVVLLPTLPFVPAGSMGGAAVGWMLAEGPEPWLMKGVSRLEYAAGYCLGVFLAAWPCLLWWRRRRARKTGAAEREGHAPP